jgi:thioredoxin
MKAEPVFLLRHTSGAVFGQRQMLSCLRNFCHERSLIFDFTPEVKAMIVSCGKCGTKNRVDEGAAGERLPVCGRCGAPLEAKESAQDTSKPLTVTDRTFARDVLQAGARPVLLDCWAAWCGPCRMIAPALEQLAKESNGRYLIAKLDVDENPQTAAQFGIQSIPTLLIFKRGALVDRMVGLQSKQAIALRLQSHG